MLSFVTAFDKQAHEKIIRFISKEKCKLDVPAMRFVFQKKINMFMTGLFWSEHVAPC